MNNRLYCEPNLIHLYFSIDLLLLSGDIADMPMEYGFDDSEIAEKFKKSYYKDFEKVIQLLSKICNNIFFIPGNVRDYNNHRLYIYTRLVNMIPT